MRISLMRISLVQFLKTFQKYLGNAFGELFISLMLFFVTNSQKNEVINPRNAVMKFVVKK